MDSQNPYNHSSNFIDLLNSQPQIPYQSFSPSIALGSSQVPVFNTQCTDSPILEENKAGGRNNRRKWTPTDDLVLISAWLNISKDAVISNEQKSRAFWKRIAQYFADSPLVGPEKIEVTQCRQRWQKINELVCKFCGSYKAAESQIGSGNNANDILKLAHQIFYNDYEKKFNLEHAWVELKDNQKWCDFGSSKLAGSKKRKCEDGSSEPPSPVEGRPPGVKAAKGKAAKGKGKIEMDDSKRMERFQSMFSLKEKDMQSQKELSKMSLLKNLLAKKELSEKEEAVKDMLLTEMLSKRK